MRLNDNVGLYHALKSCEKSNHKLIAVFIFDQSILSKLPEDDLRVAFIYQTIMQLKAELQKIGSDLLVQFGKPAQVWTKLLKDVNPIAIHANHDYEPYARERDREISALCNQKNIEFKTYRDQVIFDPWEVLKDDGKPYSVYTPYARKWRSLLDDSRVKSFSSFGSEKVISIFESGRNDIFKTKLLSLKEMGFSETDFLFPPATVSSDLIDHYGQKRNFPGILGTSHLGLHLRFGTVSVRKLVQKALKSNDPTWLSELIWREFFMQILWHYPRVVQGPFKEKFQEMKYINNPLDFKLWKEGQTGYPIVDAGMRELNATGFMHNRVRMITASFLVKHLQVDWRLGEAYFAEKLLDFDLSANNGNWQWVAGCGCDAAPYFRIFNPEIQAKKFDPDHLYIRKWVPEFESVKYQKSAVIDHAKARARALLAYKNLN